MVLEALRRKSNLFFQLFEYDQAIRAILQLLDKDNYDENAWFFLMKCYLAKGNRVAAVKTYHTCRDSLKKEMNITPDTPIEDLFHSIR